MTQTSANRGIPLERSYLACFGKRKRKLSATLNMTDSQAIETFDVLWQIAAFAAAAPEFPKVAVTPGKDEAFARKSQSLSVSAATGHFDDMMTQQSFHLKCNDQITFIGHTCTILAIARKSLRYDSFLEKPPF